MSKTSSNLSVARSIREFDEIVDRDREKEKLLLDKYLIEIKDKKQYTDLIKVINKINNELGSYKIKSLDEYYISEELKEKMILNNLTDITESEKPCYYFIKNELFKLGLDLEPYLFVKSRQKDDKIIMGYNIVTYRVILYHNYIPKAIQTESTKYQITLFLANKILERIGREPIADLLYFKDVMREKILEQEDLLEIYKKELFGRGKFRKQDINYFAKNSSGKILNIFRAMVRLIGLKVTYKKIDIYKKRDSDGKLRKTSTMIYSVVE